jgi:biofilm PGA synthesis protein PgaA
VLSTPAPHARAAFPLLPALFALLLSAGAPASDGSTLAERGNRAAELIRSAESADTIAERNQLVEDALAILDELVDSPDATEQVIARSRFDRLLALRARESMQAVTDEWEALLDDGLEPPVWVTIAAADAYLYLRQPERALELYQRALADDPERRATRQAMYWAHLESEDFRRAIELTDSLVEEAEPGTPEHQQARIAAAMVRAYANRLAEAQKRLEAIVAEHPDNSEAARNLATVYRWRGWPYRAMKQLEPLLADAPEHSGNRLLHAGLLDDLGRYAEAGKALERLHADHPENRHVQRDWAYWQERRRWAISIGGEYGDSDGIQEFGTRDRSWDMRLNAPWIGQHIQPYARIDYADARFPEGESDYDRYGVGINFHRNRHHVYVEGHANRSGPSQAGLTAGYDWQVGDHWSFATVYESFSTDVPLRGRLQGLDGWKAEAAARWQAHESLSARVGVSRLAISDGNVRHAALASLRHRIHNSAHHVTDGTLDAYYSRASQSGGPYYNPDSDASLVYLVQHDWLTWRRYERSLTQRFVFGGGAYWQEGIGTNAIGLARYEHLWQISQRWFLHYGVGAASRVYDGDRETRVDGQFRLQGVF